MKPDDLRAILHDIGMAAATVEAAIGDTPEAFRMTHEEDHAVLVGDAFVFALAMKGIIVERHAGKAALVAAEYERAPEQHARLS